MTGVQTCALPILNRMLQRNRIAYKLDKGRITRVHDEILDNRFQESDISYYAKLDSEVRQAVELFTSRNPKNIKTALTVIANAFELAKTLTYPEDKKKSVNEICKSIAGDSEKLRELLNGHFLYLTDISNNCDIRHKLTHQKNWNIFLLQIVVVCYHEYNISR